ncbi:hypothetical protein B0I37DRAFT_351213 [Chaetomium sp. MPI-CAGE-AT-0009]|nr:hypothetical protein B0I37DRAFT_351213 [Chaetomium sp. MPI-CAGE-AT-0009]
MDPLSALSVAAAVAQFAEFGYKLLKNTHEIYQSSSGQNAKTIDITTVSKDLRTLAEDMDQRIGDIQGPSAVIFRRLCQECRSVYDQLAAILEAVRRNASGSNKLSVAAASFTSAVRLASKTGQIEELASRLGEVRQQMTVALLGLLLEVPSSADKIFPLLPSRGESQRNGVEFRQFVKQQAEAMHTLDRIDQTTKNFGASLVAFVDGKSKTQTSELDSMVSYVLSERWTPSDYLERNQHEVDEQRDGANIDAIYQSIFFKSMGHREGAIPARYATTFEWMFRTPRQSEGGEPMWSDFCKWLEGDSKEIYWVTGKPGSGKSTLIKFVANDPRFEEHLRVWAGDAELVTARFFSWNAGMDPLQRTHEGLYRTLLLEVLRKKPQLIPDVFPGRWFLLQSFGRNATLPPMSKRDLEAGFRSLLHLTGGRFKVALLVDGLDEFTDDHRKLVAVLREANDRDQVKICASSRPWNVFKDAYAQSPTLQLERLTLDDMKLFVQSKLDMSPGYREFACTQPKEATQIITDLVEKASGVFLWITVISGLLETSFQEGARTKELRGIIDKLPDEISDLFQYIWARTSPRFRNEASRYFQIMELCRSHLMDLYSFTLWFGEEEIPIDLQVLDMTETYLASAQKSVERVLMSRTGGLLELFPDEEGREKRWEVRVDYMHRTASDWVEQNWETIQSAADSTFDPAFSLLKGEVLRTVLNWKDVEDPISQAHRIIKASLSLDVRYSPESQQIIGLFDRLDKRMQPSAVTSYLRGHWSDRVFQPISGMTFTRDLENIRMSIGPCRDLIGLAARLPILVYLRHVLDTDPGQFSMTSRGCDIIEELVIGELWFPNIPQRLAAVECLLARGIRPHNSSALRIKAQECLDSLSQERNAGVD